MQLHPSTRGFWLFRVLVIGGIARIVLATGCIGVEPGQESDAIEEPDGVVVADVAETPAEIPVIDLSARWLPESLVPFRLPLEATGQRHLPSPWPTRPQVVEALLGKPNWDGVRASVVGLYRAFGYKPIFMANPAARKEALELFAWLVASGELGLDPSQLGVGRLLELTGDSCRVEAGRQLGSVAHDPTLQVFEPTATPSALVLRCNESWVAAERELELDVRLVAGFFMAWGQLADSSAQGALVWDGPGSALRILLSHLPKDGYYWKRVAAFRRWTHPALAWSTDQKGKWVPLKSGVAGPRVEELNRRLQEMGFLDVLPAGREVRTYGSKTQAAVRAFRQAHGLAAKDVVDAQVVELLSLTREKRALLVWYSLNLSLARGEIHAGSYLWANLADQSLWWVHQGQLHSGYRMAAGRVLKGGGGGTEEFAVGVASAMLNPEWWPSYAQWKREIAPLAKKDRRYLENKGFEKRGNRWVQRAGPENRFGPVVLTFGQEVPHQVHGSAAAAEFSKAQRLSTSGDLHVEGLERLVETWVEQGVTEGKVDVASVLETGNGVEVSLKERVALFVVYDRIRLDTGGGVVVAGDPYGKGMPGKAVTKGIKGLLRRVTP